MEVFFFFFFSFFCFLLFVEVYFSSFPGPGRCIHLQTRRGWELRPAIPYVSGGRPRSVGKSRNGGVGMIKIEKWRRDVRLRMRKRRNRKERREKTGSRVRASLQKSSRVHLVFLFHSCTYESLVVTCSPCFVCT